MTTLIAACLALLLCGCGSDTGPLRVGRDPDDSAAGAGGFHNPGDSGPSGDGGIVSGREALAVRVHDINEMTIELVTLACAGDCADIEAVAHGGNQPYTFEWEDGSASATRRVCLDASTTLTVTATDTAIDTDELGYEAQTASADVTATVLDCSDAGVTAPDGGTGDSVYWATWTSMTQGAPGSAVGSFSPPGGTVDVAYSGEAVEPSAITGQPSTLLVIGVITFTPESTFTSSTVTNAPPPSGMISLSGDAMVTQTLTFSSPVRDPVIAVMSLGNFGVGSTWDFSAAPVVLSTGPGIIGQDGTLTASGNSLTGFEGNGVVELRGTFTSLSFTVPAPEQTAQFTIGIRGRE